MISIKLQKKKIILQIHAKSSLKIICLITQINSSDWESNLKIESMDVSAAVAQVRWELQGGLLWPHFYQDKMS